MEVLTYDPRDPAILRDPHAIFAALRESDPVHWCEPLSGWIVTDYQHVDEMLMTGEGLSSSRLTPFVARLEGEQRSIAEQILVWLNRWMVFQDPPDHTRIRRHMARLINPRSAPALADGIRTITDDLLDRVPRGESFDLLDRFGMRLPARVVLDLVGVPAARIPDVEQWADEMMLFIGSARGVPDKYKRARHGAESMAALFRELINERRSEPRDDLVTQLVQSDIKGDTLSDDELIASMMMLGNGAQATTAHLLANSLIALVDRPEAQAALRADPELMPSAVEEFLRFDGPVLSIGRIVTGELHLGGKELQPNQRIFAMLTAANRDPAAFDDPDELILDRTPNRHLAFGKGPHFCLGAPIARLEVQIALAAILERFSSIVIVEPLEEIPWTNSLTSRGPTVLPVRLS